MDQHDPVSVHSIHAKRVQGEKVHVQLFHTAQREIFKFEAPKWNFLPKALWPSSDSSNN